MNSSLRMLQQVEKYTKKFASRNDFQPNFSPKGMTCTPCTQFHTMVAKVSQMSRKIHILFGIKCYQGNFQWSQLTVD